MGNNRAALKLTVLLVSSLTIMSVITISPALPAMSADFSHIPNGQFIVQMVLTIPALFISLTSPLAGMLIDRFGRLKLLYLAMVLYAIAGTSGFYLDNLYYILISRAVLGIAVGMSMTIVITLIADYFQGQERQKFTGIQVAFMSLGGILLVSLGGFLADISWRTPFLIYILSLVFLPMAVIYLYEPEVQRSTEHQTRQVKSPPLIWLLIINTMIMWILFFILPVHLPFHLKAMGVEKNALIGIAVAISTLFSAISSFSYSKIKGRFSYYSIFFMGYLIMGIGLALTSWATSFPLILVAMMFAGFGIGMMIPNTNLWIMQLAPPAIRGREIGKLTMFWFMGQFLSPIITLPLTGKFELPQLFMAAAVLQFILSATFLLLHVGQEKKEKQLRTNP